MEEHTLKLTNVHTQLLLQMQNEINIQMMNKRLIASENELKTTKTILDEKEKELQSIKRKLEASEKELQGKKDELMNTQKQLILFTKDSEQKENQIKFLQEDIRDQMQAIQEIIKPKIETADKLDDNELLMLDARLTEIFSNAMSESNSPEKFSIEKIFKSFQSKEPINKFKPIEPFYINGKNLEFPKLKQLVKVTNSQTRFSLILTRLVNGELYHIDDNQLIFKLHLPKNHRWFRIEFVDIAWVAKTYPDNIIIRNDYMVVYDEGDDDNARYEILLEIPNYDNENSIAYMYPKNETGKKLTLDCGKFIKGIDIDGYKNELNEILFHVVKHI